MSDKRSMYEESDIVTIEYDDGVKMEFGIMGTFELDGTEYIALDNLSGEQDEVYLYKYVPLENDFELQDIPEEEFDRVAEEFDRLMDGSV